MSKPKAPRKASPAVIAIIEETVERVIKRMLAEKRASPDDCYKQTIKRIKAIPVLQERIADNTARLECPVQEKSKSIVRFSASGVRSDPEEMYDAIMCTLEAHIAADQEEVDEMMKALNTISNDYYYPVVYDAFILHRTDESLAQELCCDLSTVRRNRRRLVTILSIRLYGVFAE